MGEELKWAEIIELKKTIRDFPAAPLPPPPTKVCGLRLSVATKSCFLHSGLSLVYVFKAVFLVKRYISGNICTVPHENCPEM